MSYDKISERIGEARARILSLERRVGDLEELNERLTERKRQDRSAWLLATFAGCIAIAAAGFGAVIAYFLR